MPLVIRGLATLAHIYIYIRCYGLYFGQRTKTLTKYIQPVGRYKTITHMYFYYWDNSANLKTIFWGIYLVCDRLDDYP